MGTTQKFWLKVNWSKAKGNGQKVMGYLSFSASTNQNTLSSFTVKMKLIQSIINDELLNN
jgi:hypothetical protein